MDPDEELAELQPNVGLTLTEFRDGFAYVHEQLGLPNPLT